MKDIGRFDIFHQPAEEKEGAMRRRLYFVLPDVSTAREAFNKLLLARIDEGHIQFLSNNQSELKDLPAADPWHRSDLVHAMSQGLFVGGLTGVVVGAFIVLNPPDGLAAGGGVVLGLAMLGAIFGTWVSGLIGFDVPNTRLQRFEGALAEGKVLMMVDVPKPRVDDIRDLIHDSYPQADLRGAEPTIPAFP
jgi:hypothetical protein